MNAARRVSQFGALAVLLLLPMLSRGSALFESYGAGARHLGPLTTPWELFLYRAFSFLFGGLAQPADFAALFQGRFWSITLFGITFNDPLAAIGHTLATRSVYLPMLAGTLVAVVVAVFAGRAFCGWLCPVGTILELNDALRRWVERRVRIRLPQWLPTPRLRILVLAGGALGSAAAGVNLFPMILPYAGLARDWHLVVFGAGIGMGAFFMIVLIGVEMLGAPRLWCRSLCPTGLLLAYLGRRGVVGIVRDKSGPCLDGCQLCATTCRFGVMPRDTIATPDCTMCNACVTKCPTGVLAIKPTRAVPWRRGLAVCAMLAFVGLGAPDAGAHHIKGLPHYAYLENYPQTPATEQIILAPPFEVVVVIYRLDGIDRSQSADPNDTTLFISVVNQETQESYRGGLGITLTSRDGVSEQRLHQPLEETVYRFRASIGDAPHDLTVRIEGPPATVATGVIDLGAGLNTWLVASLAVGVFAALGLAIIAIRRKVYLVSFRVRAADGR